MVCVYIFNFFITLVNLIYKICVFKAQEVEETMKRIQSHKGVVGTIVVNAEGIRSYERIVPAFILL